MALALIFAAFLGAVLGLVWQSSGIGEDKDEEKEELIMAETPPG